MLYLLSAWSKITIRSSMNDCCLLVSLSLKRALVGGRLFRPNVGHLEFISLYSHHRNPRSKSGLCCRVRRSFLHIDAVVSACTFPRPCVVVVDYNQFYTARKSSTDPEKSRDHVQTRGFTFGDSLVTMSHIFVTAFSVVACSFLLRTCFFLVSSISVHGSGRV